MCVATSPVLNSLALWTGNIDFLRVVMYICIFVSFFVFLVQCYRGVSVCFIDEKHHEVKFKLMFLSMNP